MQSVTTWTVLGAVYRHITQPIKSGIELVRVRRKSTIQQNLVKNSWGEADSESTAGEEV